MIKFSNSRNYIIVRDGKELEAAKNCDLCRYIIMEKGNVIHMWEFLDYKWRLRKYTVFDRTKETDDKTTGREAYQRFYKYCGKSEIERMKTLLKPIELWESHEQLSYCNLDYIGTKIEQDIYEFDVNSSFGYGATVLKEGFELLSQYMQELYIDRINAKTDFEKARFKNLMVYLVGCFARIKEFVALRSEIIKNSNDNVLDHILKIRKNGGTVYISNTDSIITDTKGAEVMLPIVSDRMGGFKLSTYTNRLYYRAAKIYQLGDKVKYSGVPYFARKHTDFFKGYDAEQKGRLIEGYDFIIDSKNSNSIYSKVCRVRNGKIIVTIVNQLGEFIKQIEYRLGD